MTQVFRQVDRSDYMIFEDDDDPLEAYEDHAWRKNTLHLSAPCIYSRAMEALKLEKGIRVQLDKYVYVIITLTWLVL